MLRLLERGVASVEQRMVLVAPPDVTVPPTFRNATADPTLREALVRQVQRLRGAIYLDDGAIRPDQLSNDGRHCTPEDARSWHLLFLNAHNRISSAIWFLHHHSSVAVDQLRIRHSPLARSAEARDRTYAAVNTELARARQEGLQIGEVGGWAVAPESRCTPEGLLLALGSFSLANLLGGTFVLTTATARHCSASILRRLGGSLLEADGEPIPAYFDPEYDCDMELLRFDSRKPNPKYSSLIERLQDKLCEVPVIATAVAPVLTLDSYEFPEVPALHPAAAY